MTISTVLVLSAAAAALVLVAQTQKRTFPLVALVVAGVQVLLHFGMVRLSAAGVPLGLVLSAALAVGGGAAWSASHDKLAVTAATVVFVAGAAQVLAQLF